MLYIGLFLIFFGVFIFLFALINANKQSQHVKSQFQINAQVKSLLEQNDFKISKEYYLNDNHTMNKSQEFKKMILIDSNKCICLIDYMKGSILIVDCNEIVNYEVYMNDTQITTGARIGGLIGFFGAETESSCKNLRLIIRLNKIDYPQICYNIIDDTLFNIGISKSSKLYQECINSLQEAVSLLEVIINKNK